MSRKIDFLNSTIRTLPHISSPLDSTEVNNRKKNIEEELKENSRKEAK
jgi:hypothetical protein